jgi:hypothetical protein
MKAQLQEIGTMDQRILAIGTIMERIRLLHKCRRKMKVSLIDPDNYRIYVAAHQQLSAEIDDLCHDVGL